ncbi:hypothetical protein HGM15179_018833 [Zosterops borbonicus]|uniref:CCHC-type domain-containing protein n=1 Tax=Zosterops borbonicus TaxID=364589 RepID=A0A8K1D7W1_9PASS|nr:hypothetical protein HGM15179_020900 [Zosterops borbonicus]TRZ08279.1 hypothetical protein HGM15179_018833 [Zosterops borbonicus]
MDDYRNLMIKRIRESVPRSNNSKLAFDNMQGKDETPATWLNTIKQNFQLYSSINPESPEGQVLLKTQFVTKSWPDIRRKLEKMEDWQEKGINELLREALRVYLRREKVKARMKAKTMVAVARESVSNQGPPNREDGKPVKGKRNALPPWVISKKQGEDWKCFYCGETEHLKGDCQKLSLDEAIKEEQDALEKLIRGGK